MDSNDELKPHLMDLDGLSDFVDAVCDSFNEKNSETIGISVSPMDLFWMRMTLTAVEELRMVREELQKNRKPPYLPGYIEP